MKVMCNELCPDPIDHRKNYPHLQDIQLSQTKGREFTMESISLLTRFSTEEDAAGDADNTDYCKGRKHKLSSSVAQPLQNDEQSLALFSGDMSHQHPLTSYTHDQSHSSRSLTQSKTCGDLSQEGQSSTSVQFSLPLTVSSSSSLFSVSSLVISSIGINHEDQGAYDDDDVSIDFSPSFTATIPHRSVQLGFSSAGSNHEDQPSTLPSHCLTSDPHSVTSSPLSLQSCLPLQPPCIISSAGHSCSDPVSAATSSLSTSQSAVFTADTNHIDVHNNSEDDDILNNRLLPMYYRPVGLGDHIGSSLTSSWRNGFHSADEDGKSPPCDYIDCYNEYVHSNSEGDVLNNCLLPMYYRPIGLGDHIGSPFTSSWRNEFHSEDSADKSAPCDIDCYGDTEMKAGFRREENQPVGSHQPPPRIGYLEFRSELIPQQSTGAPPTTGPCPVTGRSRSDDSKTECPRCAFRSHQNASLHVLDDRIRNRLALLQSYHDQQQELHQQLMVQERESQLKLMAEQRQSQQQLMAKQRQSQHQLLDQQYQQLLQQL